MDTELGLKNLEYLLKPRSEEASSSEYLDFVGWSRELRESIEIEKRFVGLDQNEQVRRQFILRQLDGLALKHTRKSFLDLCRTRLPLNASQSAEKRTDPVPVAEGVETDSLSEALLKDQVSGVQAGPVEVFFSYSHRDEELRDELERHLSTLRRQGIIKSWHDRRIGAGREWEGEIDSHLRSAQIILFLVSANLLASDYVYDVELKLAMTRHRENEAVVIPIILRPCDWQESPLGKLQPLPTDGRPVTTWQDRDEAFLNVTKGIRLVIKEQFSKKK
jgi:TIR domain-containing protein